MENVTTLLGEKVDLFDGNFRKGKENIVFDGEEVATLSPDDTLCWKPWAAVARILSPKPGAITPEQLEQKWKDFLSTR